MNKPGKGQITGLLSPFLEGLRLRKIARHVRLGAQILDVGCGRGRILDYIPGPKRYIGLDVLEDLIARNRELLPHAEFICMDLEKDFLPPGAGMFDTIIMGAVIEHFSEPQIIIEKLCGHLLPGGKIILTTPSPEGKLLLKAGVKVRLLSREADAEHHALLGKTEIIKISDGNHLELSYYRHFLFGLNQIAVLTAPAP